MKLFLLTDNINVFQIFSNGIPENTSLSPMLNPNYNPITVHTPNCTKTKRSKPRPIRGSVQFGVWTEFIFGVILGATLNAGRLSVFRENRLYV